AAAACGLVFGIHPALHASSVDGQAALTRTRTAGASGASTTIRRALVVVEVALALVLLAGAGLMGRTLERVAAVDAGFDTDRLLSLQVSMQDRVRGLPGVVNAAVTTALPIRGATWTSVFTVADQPAPPRERLPLTTLTVVSSEYFTTLRTSLVRGRTFTAADRSAAPVIVINERLAAQMWPGQDPVGKRLRQGFPEGGGPWREIVGVIRDIKLQGLTEEPPNQVYIPLAEAPPWQFTVVVRTAADPLAARATIESAIRAVSRDFPIFGVRTMTELLEQSIAQERLAALVLTVFALVAVSLAAIGLYGVMAHAVTERTHEIGVRMALGATRRNVLGMVVAGGVKMTIVGTIAGVCG